MVIKLFQKIGYFLFIFIFLHFITILIMLKTLIEVYLFMEINNCNLKKKKPFRASHSGTLHFSCFEYSLKICVKYKIFDELQIKSVSFHSEVLSILDMVVHLYPSCSLLPHHQIERFTHRMDNMTPLGPDASLHYARGLFSMPNLKSLQLIDPNLSDEFYSTMATEASHSKVQYI